MRIIVFSDTHQNTALLEQCVAQALHGGKIDAFIHCGDGVRDLACVEQALLQANPSVRIYAVRGNCDFAEPHYPVSELAEFNGVRAFITHGNAYQVKQGLGKLSKAGRELNAQLIFFGHTHTPCAEEKHGVLLINPGLLSSYPLYKTAYLEVLVDMHQKVCVNFIKQD